MRRAETLACFKKSLIFSHVVSYTNTLDYTRQILRRLGESIGVYSGQLALPFFVYAEHVKKLAKRCVRAGRPESCRVDFLIFGS